MNIHQRAPYAHQAQHALVRSFYRFHCPIFGSTEGAWRPVLIFMHVPLRPAFRFSTRGCKFSLERLSYSKRPCHSDIAVISCWSVRFYFNVTAPGSNSCSNDALLCSTGSFGVLCGSCKVDNPIMKYPITDRHFSCRCVLRKLTT